MCLEDCGLPLWKSHKEVAAFKIDEIQEYTKGAMLLSSIGDTVEVSEEYLERHQPKIGGYYVRYKDGYESFSPAQAFEQGYTRIG